MASPNPRRDATLIENEDTSVISVRIRRTAKALRTLSTPTNTGTAAATMPPKMKTNSTRVIGMAMASATTRSFSSLVLNATPTTVLPANCASAPSTSSFGKRSAKVAGVTPESGANVIATAAMDPSFESRLAFAAASVPQYDFTEAVGTSVLNWSTAAVTAGPMSSRVLPSVGE